MKTLIILKSHLDEENNKDNHWIFNIVAGIGQWIGW